MKKASFVYQTKALFSTMRSAFAERDTSFGRDACFASDVRFTREEAEHITSLRPAGATSLLPLAANTSLAPQGANITLQT
ncbi:MAG: hypothetical protein K6G71_07380 [Clostridiales bacterium]|nr:hypothetical protein [Clostridiales bacterium]